MTVYGSWESTLEIDGIDYGADLIEDRYARNAGFSQIFAVNGLPERFEVDLIKSSQVSDVPHTWRVKECQSVDQVSAEVLQQGKEVLDRDRSELGSRIITFVGVSDLGAGDYIFLAAGAIRNRLARDYENDEFPVVSRAIVAPGYRGRGVGSLIVDHRYRAVLRFFSRKPKAIHFGTESPKILSSLRRIEREEGIKYVHIGNEKYTTLVGVHTVADYLCFLPWYQVALLNACVAMEVHSCCPEVVREFSGKFKLFMSCGIKGVLGVELERLYNESRDSIRFGGLVRGELELFEEFFFIKRKIGAADPD
ncbi:hypothetical protein JNK13_07375 [bacterium]|nr:hypothetical protein [bacterium]